MERTGCLGAVGTIRFQRPVKAHGQPSLCQDSGALNQTRETYLDLSPFSPSKTPDSADRAPHTPDDPVCGRTPSEVSVSKVSDFALKGMWTEDPLFFLPSLRRLSVGRPSLVLRAGQTPLQLFPQPPVRPLFWLALRFSPLGVVAVLVMGTVASLAVFDRTVGTQ